MKKLLMAEIKFCEVRQIASNKKPMPKEVSSKQFQEEKPKQPERISNELESNDFFDFSKYKVNVNSPREVSPTNARVGHDEIAKQQGIIENKKGSSPAISKKKEQFNIQFQPLNFDPFKRRESQDIRQAQGPPSLNLPQIKSKYSVSPPNHDSTSGKNIQTNLIASKEPRINQLPKSNINNARPVSPVNSPNQKHMQALSRLKSVLDKSPEIPGESKSCRSNRSEIVRYEKPEIRAENKSPRRNANVKQKVVLKREKIGESVSYVSKENASINVNIRFRKGSVTPPARSNVSFEKKLPQPQPQPQPQLQRRGSVNMPLAKVIEMRLNKKPEESESFLKDEIPKAVNVSGGRSKSSKRKLTIQIEELESGDEGIERKRVIFNKFMMFF